MSKNYHIAAAVQFQPKLLDVQSNLAIALQLTFEAAAKGAKIIVLPELCLSGFVIENIREAIDVAQEANGYQTQKFVNLAKQFNCYITFGYVELLRGKLYNAAAVVGPSGLLGNAQKHNLWGSDNLWAQPSECISPVILTPFGRLGVLICRDVANKYRESYVHHRPGQRFYDKGNIDTIALVTNWGGEYGFPDASWVELVEDTKANVIVSNRVGSERNMTFNGGSCIIDRNRKIWTNGSNFNETAVVGGLILE